MERQFNVAIDHIIITVVILKANNHVAKPEYHESGLLLDGQLH